MEFKSPALNSYFMNIRNMENRQAVANFDESSLGDDTLQVAKDDSSIQNLIKQHRMQFDSDEKDSKYSASLKSAVDAGIKNKLKDYLNDSMESSIISDVPDTFPIDMSQLEDEPIEKKANKMLGFSRQSMELTLIQTQEKMESIKIMNRHVRRVTLIAKLSEPVTGIKICCPSALETLTATDIVLEIGEVEEIGDIFNSIIIEAISKENRQIYELPLKIKYVEPRLTVEYEGASQVLTLSSGKFMDIKLPQTAFKEHSLYLSSASRIQVILSTPMIESTIFPDELTLIDGSKRKVGIRSRESRFCLVAAVKDTKLAFVFRITIY